MLEGQDNPVKFIRLNTGEDIISEVIFMESDETHYLFVNPLKIVYNLGKRNDSVILAFSPWIFSSLCEKQEFPVYPNDVLTIADPSEDVTGAYWEFVERMSIERNEEMIQESEQDFLRGVLESVQQLPGRKLH